MSTADMGLDDFGDGDDEHKYDLQDGRRELAFINIAAMPP